MVPGRVISTVDPDARHGHRSRTDRYDGYKLHVSADVDSDLICSATATLATVHDAAVVGDLIDADPVPVAEIIADTHYGSGPTRQAMADRGIDLVAPAQPIPTRGDMLTKADFDIDLDTATITCPQGNTATIPPPNGDKRRQVRFAATDCAACELKPRCTTRGGGRIVEINPHEELLAPARAQRHEPEFLARYRLRAQAERKIAQIKSRTKNVPRRGLDKANLWLDLRVAALNLDRAGRLGIIRQNTRAPPATPGTTGRPTMRLGIIRHNTRAQPTPNHQPDHHHRPHNRAHPTNNTPHNPIADHPPSCAADVGGWRAGVGPPSTRLLRVPSVHRR